MVKDFAKLRVRIRLSLLFKGGFMFLRYLGGIFILGVIFFVLPVLLRAPDTSKVLFGVLIVLVLVYPIYAFIYKAIQKWRKEKNELP